MFTPPPRIAFGKLACVATFTALMLMGCSPNNDLQINTALGKVTSGGTVHSPLGSQPITGQWVADIPTSSPLNTVDDTPVGYIYSIDGVTLAYGYEAYSGWPTYFSTANDRMPALWDFQWEHPDYCVSQVAPYPLLPNPDIETNQVLLPTSAWSEEPPVQWFTCYVNSPANPDFVATEVNPQFVLDDALPSTIQVSAFSSINAATSITNLHLYSMSLTNPANVTASSVASDGSNAVFPFPTTASGAALPAGPYITTITTDPVGGPQTTNGMEPIYIAHNDTTWPSAFGVDVAIPTKTIETTHYYMMKSPSGIFQCTPMSSESVLGGSSLPLVTLPQLGELAVGTSANTIKVGTNPTIVIAYNGMTMSSTTTISGCQTGSQTVTYSGAQSALVVNTGSNNVSLLNIGQYNYPSGTVSVGTQPVAAVINPAGTMAYIANYGSGTISEISLQNVQVTRTLAVAAYPTSVAFDSNGNLWVGGQGSLQLISLLDWSISTTYPIDGTITGMNYYVNKGVFVAQVIQNGSASSPSNGKTGRKAMVFSRAGGLSYSSTILVNVASGASTTLSSVVGDTAPYVMSRLATSLVHPAQSAFNPPIYTSSGGDLIASAEGNTFTVTSLSTGKVLVGGTTPYPIRGVKFTSTMLYLTMPDSNSLVTLPLQLP